MLALFAINIVEVGVNGNIGSELPEAQILQRRLSETGHTREGDASFAGNFGRIEQDEFVNEAAG